MPVLKLKNHDEKKEREFEIENLLKMSCQQRFKMMFEKTQIIKNLLKQNGHTWPPQIIKRKAG